MPPDRLHPFFFQIFSFLFRQMKARPELRPFQLIQRLFNRLHLSIIPLSFTWLLLTIVQRAVAQLFQLFLIFSIGDTGMILRLIHPQAEYPSSRPRPHRLGRILFSSSLLRRQGIPPSAPQSLPRNGNRHIPSRQTGVLSQSNTVFSYFRIICFILSRGKGASSGCLYSIDSMVATVSQFSSPTGTIILSPPL